MRICRTKSGMRLYSNHWVGTSAGGWFVRPRGYNQHINQFSIADADFCVDGSN